MTGLGESSRHVGVARTSLPGSVVYRLVSRMILVNSDQPKLTLFRCITAGRIFGARRKRQSVMFARGAALSVLDASIIFGGGAWAQEAANSVIRLDAEGPQYTPASIESKPDAAEPREPPPLLASAAGYRLARGDEVEVRIVDEPDYERVRLRLDERGRIRVPWVGEIRADGKTTSELEIALERRFGTYFHEPRVQARVSDYAGRPVSVLGAVRKPGIHQLRGPRTLVEVLALAGGLTSEAGHVVKITRPLARGRIPLSTARDDPSGRFSVASASIENVLKAARPAENILIEAHDVLSIPRAELVYVLGAVARSGGFVLRENENLSVLRALALAGGISGTAAARRAKILRSPSAGTQRAEETVDLRKIMESRADDVALNPDDILFVPISGGKAAAKRAAQAAIRTVTGVLIFRR